MPYQWSCTHSLALVGSHQYINALTLIPPALCRVQWSPQCPGSHSSSLSQGTLSLDGKNCSPIQQPGREGGKEIEREREKESMRESVCVRVIVLKIFNRAGESALYHVSKWHPTQTQNFIRSPTAAPVQTANQHPLSGQYRSHVCTHTLAGTWFNITVWCEYYHITIALDRSEVTITSWLDTAHQFSQWPGWGNSFIPQKSTNMLHNNIVLTRMTRNLSNIVWRLGDTWSLAVDSDATLWKIQISSSIYCSSFMQTHAVLHARLP
jgi:hypothetical protein